MLTGLMPMSQDDVVWLCMWRMCAACLGMVVGMVQLYSEKICHVVSIE